MSYRARRSKSILLGEQFYPCLALKQRTSNDDDDDDDDDDDELISLQFIMSDIIFPLCS